MIETALYLFIAACLLVIAVWLGSLIIDRLPASEAVKNIFRIIGLLVILIILVVVAVGFLPGHQPFWR